MAENSNSRTGSGWPCKRLPGRSRKGKGGGDTTCGGTSQPHQAGKGGARSSPKGVVGQSDCPGGSRRVEAAPIQSRTLRSARREVQRTEGVASLQESVTERRRANSPVAPGEQLNGMVNVLVAASHVLVVVGGEFRAGDPFLRAVLVAAVHPLDLPRVVAAREKVDAPLVHPHHGGEVVPALELDKPPLRQTAHD